jgi:hypothetical protein
LRAAGAAIASGDIVKARRVLSTTLVVLEQVGSRQ